MEHEEKKEHIVHFRRYARIWIMQFLFQKDISEMDLSIDEYIKIFTSELREIDLFESPQKSLFKRAYKESLKLLSGILEKHEEIDEILSSFASQSKWTLKRMDVVDRNIMRIAIYEMKYCNNVPPVVSIDEAVEIGKKYGSEHSPAFINGILNSIKNSIINRPAREPLQSNENSN